jgi:hypothetical protein
MNTGAAESGTVEEIDQFVAAGKPALLYFSSRPISPNRIDLKQQERLNVFKEATCRKATIGRFSDLNELREALLRDLMKLVRQIKSSPDALKKESLGIAPKWQNSANLFWVGYDLMWTMQISLRGLSPKEILRGLNKSKYHLASLNLTGSLPFQHVAKLLHEIENVEFQWSERQRAWLATEIDAVCVEVGNLAAQNQPDFETDLSVTKTHHATG